MTWLLQTQHSQQGGGSKQKLPHHKLKCIKHKYRQIYSFKDNNVVYVKSIKDVLAQEIKGGNDAAISVFLYVWFQQLGWEKGKRNKQTGDFSFSNIVSKPQS